MPLIVPMHERDWTSVRAIYEQGLRTGHASFETTAPSWDAWNAAHVAECRFVAATDEDRDDILGWTALSRTSKREVYAGVAEVSVYVRDDMHGRGIGRLLLSELIRASEAAGFWTLQASIFPENTGSCTLHERCGFRLVGRRERIAQHYGRWRDTLLFERRSSGP